GTELYAMQVLAADVEYERSPGIAKRYFAVAAEAGQPVAMTALARYAQYGVLQPVDLEEAFRLDRAAADRGLPKASYNVALAALHGAGTPRDPEAAFAMLKAVAASQARGPSEGLPDRAIRRAHMQLAVMLESGVGTPRDVGRAIGHYEAARALGYRPAFLALARLTLPTSGPSRAAELVEEARHARINEPWPAADEVLESSALLRPSPEIRASLDASLAALAAATETSPDLARSLEWAQAARGRGRLLEHQLLQCWSPEDRARLPWCDGHERAAAKVR
ncbi:MAG: tetratricopeptide repeat protein, partial [Myxococcota bacterium]